MLFSLATDLIWANWVHGAGQPKSYKLGCFAIGAADPCRIKGLGRFGRLELRILEVCSVLTAFLKQYRERFHHFCSLGSWGFELGNSHEFQWNCPNRKWWLARGLHIALSTGFGVGHGAETIRNMLLARRIQQPP